MKFSTACLFLLAAHPASAFVANGRARSQPMGRFVVTDPTETKEVVNGATVAKVEEPEAKDAVKVEMPKAEPKKMEASKAPATAVADIATPEADSMKGALEP